MNNPDFLQRIVMIGAGNVATHLALAIQAAGFQVVGVYSRTMASAQLLGRRLESSVVTDDIARLPDADLYIISVKDDAIPIVARELAATCPWATVVHTAGSVPMRVLAQIFACCGVLYPMQTFSRQREVDFSAVPLFVEGSTSDVTASLQAFAERLSRSVTIMNSEQRRYLHLASVFACNFVNHCYDMAFGICEAQGIDPQVLLPLIAETASKVRELHPHQGQTGPARRGDVQVLGYQRELLADNESLQHLYDTISHNIFNSFSEE